MNVWLDAMLGIYNLTNRDLVLVGFSQGSILATLVGARRNACGVIVCGGVPFVGKFELAKRMPKTSRARFLAVNGAEDAYVQRKPLEAMLAPYDCEWHWSEGLGHDFPPQWYAVGMAWMQKLLDQ